AIVVIIFCVRLFGLQIVNGEDFLATSERNRLERIPIFAERGVIYDRNGVELAWNEKHSGEEPFSFRKYKTGGFAHLLGYVKYPTKDSSGFYWRKAIEGKDGIEKWLDDYIGGQNGSKLIEVNARFETISESSVIAPKDGDNITLTIDSDLQHALYTNIKNTIDTFDYQGGAGVVIDVTNGEIIALVSAPEYDSNILSVGEDKQAITDFFDHPGKPFLNRAVSGVYTPGSIVKPFVALAALQEGIITKSYQFRSIGQIEIPNKYDPDNPSIFRDNRPDGYGMTNVTKAIAESVNTFFYVISGGYQGRDGLGIDRISKIMRDFGFETLTNIDIPGEAIGVVPNPKWKEKIFGEGWRLGDTYITGIGQFGFQVTPIQMVRSVSALANGGILVSPHVVKDPLSTDSKLENIKDVSAEHLKTVHEGMRQTVTDGTAPGLNVSYEKFAAKTGTAQVAGKTRINSWVTGFFPYEQPKYAFVIVMERGPLEGAPSATWIARWAFDDLREINPEFFTPKQ
ncbi:MAG: penicillin-binding transpeptidase domain-containing protein, partial [Candidatus Nomurabacteria bacterium]|nr:penicillin-binding transpeptidase domain-containing protein [Candidatus Nomurabacteria bacterium]